MPHDPCPPAELLEPLADRDDLQAFADDTELTDARGCADRDPLPGVKLEVFPPVAD